MILNILEIINKIKFYENNLKVLLNNYIKRLKSPGYEHFLLSLLSNIEEHLNELDEKSILMDLSVKYIKEDIEEIFSKNEILKSDLRDNFWESVIIIEDKKISLYKRLSKMIDKDFGVIFDTFKDDENKLKLLALDRYDLEKLTGM